LWPWTWHLFTSIPSSVTCEVLCLPSLAAWLIVGVKFTFLKTLYKASSDLGKLGYCEHVQVLPQNPLEKSWVQESIDWINLSQPC
jgi:hypothetical protein